jgi:uncharacterized protein (DUF58 family)
MFFFRKSSEGDNLRGLSVSVDELIEQRKFLPYIKKKHNTFTSDQAGDIRSAFKGRGMEFDEVRTYGFGDDVRDIDWRVTARKNEPYTKVFSEEKDREVYVVLDLSAYMLFGTKKELKSVAAAKLAALLGWQSMANKDRFGLVLYDGIETRIFKPQNNQKNLMAVLKAISKTSDDILKETNENRVRARNDITEPLRFLQYNIKSRAMVFVLSDFKKISAEGLKSLVTLTKRCRVYCVNIYDYIEEVPPESGEYMAEYNGEKLIFDSSPEAFKRTYYNYFLEKRQTMENFCHKFNCQYLNIRTDRPLYKQLKIL